MEDLATEHGKPMTAEQIRQMDLYKGPEAYLREIAAQLADLNEHLKLVDESVFGTKPKGEQHNDTSKGSNKTHISRSR